MIRRCICAAHILWYVQQQRRIPNLVSSSSSRPSNAWTKLEATECRGRGGEDDLDFRASPGRLSTVASGATPKERKEFDGKDAKKEREERNGK